MNFSEFKERLGAEPRTTAEALRADARTGAEAGTDAHGERLALAREAEAFEDRLEAVLRAPDPGPELLEDILGQTKSEPRRSRPPAWLAMAASVVLLVGVAYIAWWQSASPPELRDYVRTHYQHDGADVLSQADSPMPPDQVEAVFASLGATALPEFARRVSYIKFCPTPNSRGAHMIVDTGDGKATVIFMPAVTVEAPVLLHFDGVEARVVGLTTGSAAIIGASEADMKALQASLEEGVLPRSADA